MKDYQNWKELTKTDKHAVLIDMKNIIKKQKCQDNEKSRLDPTEDLVEERISILEDKYEYTIINVVQIRT